MSSYLTRAKEILSDIVSDRRTLHKNPEVGMELPSTTAFVAQRLREMGIEPNEIVPCGLTAVIGSKKGGKTILLRADMDALPVCELSGVSFASQNGSMHACGHDLHTAMLLGAARLLKENEAELPGTVKLMFQPNEEGSTGADAMIKAGILESPHVDAAMAFHVLPGERLVGEMIANPGPSTASSDRFRITVRGQGCHGATPHLGVDPISVAAHIQLSLQMLTSREVNCRDPLVVTVGSFHSGFAANILPDEAVMEGTIRAVNPSTRAFVKERMKEICELTARQFRAACTVEYSAGHPSCHNDPALTAEMTGYLAPLGILPAPVDSLMVSEDFSLLSQQVPSVFFWLGAGGTDREYQGGVLHNPTVRFNEEVLPLGAAGLAHCAHEWLKSNT